MKALLMEAYQQLSIVELDIPRPNDDEVLIRIHSTGICGSDVHGVDGSTGRRIPPIVMGHEAAGIIEAAGAKVWHYKAGDRVTFDSTIFCGECLHCKAGNVNFCEKRRVLGVGCDEYHQAGTFAEYISVPERILHRLPENVNFDQGAMVEPLSIAVHAVSITPIKPEDRALVIGAGVIGLLTLQVLIAQGCSEVHVTDLNDSRLQAAKKLGAHAVFNSRAENPVDAVMKHTSNTGVDCVFDAVGLQTTVNAGIRSLRKGGTLTAIGNFAPEIQIPLQYIVSRQIRVQGSNASAGEFPECIRMISQEEVDVNSLISRTVQLSEGAHWMKILHKGESDLLKVILHP